MSSPRARYLAFVGPRGSGKTTFLVAMRYQLRRLRKTESGLEYRNLSQEMDRLSAIESAWLKCQPTERTTSSLSTDNAESIGTVALSTGGSEFELIVPDFSGEGFKEQWQRRHASRDYVDLISRTAGLALFVHPLDVKEPLWIADLDALAEAGGEGATPSETGDADTPSEPAGVEWNEDQVNTQVVFVELLQIIKELRRDLGSVPKLSVVVSAWDTIQEKYDLPDDYIALRLPLLSQYLDANSGTWTVRYFGVSAFGGDPKKDAVRLREVNNPEERPFVVSRLYRGRDLSSVIAWFME